MRVIAVSPPTCEASADADLAEMNRLVLLWYKLQWLLLLKIDWKLFDTASGCRLSTYTLVTHLIG